MWLDSSLYLVPFISAMPNLCRVYFQFGLKSYQFTLGWTFGQNKRQFCLICPENKYAKKRSGFFLWKNWIAMKFELFSNLRPAGDAVAAAWVKFTPLNGETHCSTCVTQNIKENCKMIFRCFYHHSLDKHVNCQQSIYLFKGGRTFWRNYFWARMVTISSSVNSLTTWVKSIV